jgi:hypothetical protein
MVDLRRSLWDSRLVESGTTQSRRLSNRLFYNSKPSNLGTDFKSEPLRMAILRAAFFTFWSIFAHFGRFSSFFVADFPFLITF